MKSIHDPLHAGRDRRSVLANIAMAAVLAPALARPAWGQGAPAAGAGVVFDVRTFGATGDGKTIDSPAINRAIQAASGKGGVVYVPAGTYACYSLRLASSVTLYVDAGATILAADTPREGTASMMRPRAMRPGRRFRTLATTTGITA